MMVSYWLDFGTQRERERFDRKADAYARLDIVRSVGYSRATVIAIPWPAHDRCRHCNGDHDGCTSSRPLCSAASAGDAQ